MDFLTTRKLMDTDADLMVSTPADIPLLNQKKTFGIVESRAGNEPNQLENSSILDLIIGSLNLVHEPNESNLS
ncbi:hypothetical protein MTR_1g069115 [Medicago truncatula]|uniref:Uncharacterized protein n=1 Tax=Medicago truncatula TaxID=3880 RepID=A0A072VK85_MEDTR|nr:hypothetical protein MTR_1g069115 [Medicago truncatula]